MGIGCFAVMALTHVFESFSVLPSLGWGRAHSVGHFIDFGRGIAWCYVGDDEFLASGPEWPRSGKVAPSNNRWSGP